jgi:flagellin-like hook-associated protein FlgL
MSRIGATISGLERFFLTHLSRLEQSTIDSAIRLATGQRIHRPADDPAAFLEISGLEHHWRIIQQTQEQVTAATTVGAEAQLTLDELRTQLESIRSALLQDEQGELTAEERTVQQATIDAALADIDDLARTEILGRRFLDGSVNFTYTGRNSSQIRAIEVYALRETSFSATVSSPATRAQLTAHGAAGALVSSDATFTLSGRRGAATLLVTANEPLADAAARINAQSHRTGITAEVTGNNLLLTTVDYGAAATIDLDVASGALTTSAATAASDAVVTINGQPVDNSAIDGNRVSYYSTGTHVVFDLQAGFSGAVDPLTVTDGQVASFLLSPNLRQTTQLAVPGIGTAILGGVSGRLSDLASGGTLAGLGTNAPQALRVVDEALAQLTRVRGAVDAFADVTVASAAALLERFDEGFAETLDQVNGVDEEEEALILEQNQVLSSNSVAALSVLQQQQADLVELVRLIAGL